MVHVPQLAHSNWTTPRMLHSSWAVFVETPKKGSPWIDSIQKIFAFCHATDFWAWHDHSAIPSALPSHVRSLRVFKEGVSLLSEDAENCQAGRILLECSNKEEGNRYWLMCLLFAISDECGMFAPLVNGIVASVRKAVPASSSSSSSSNGGINKSNHKKQPLTMTNHATATTAASIETTIRIEVWLHSSASSTPSTPATTTADDGNDGGGGNGSLIEQFMSKLRTYLQLDNNNNHSSSVSIKYQPHYNPEEKDGK